jgi:long-chain acyl-CoA synthetase
VYDGVLKNVSEQPPLKQKIFHTALAISRERNSLLEFGKPVSAWLEFKHRIADKVVFSNIRQKLGGRLQYVLNLLLPTPPKSIFVFDVTLHCFLVCVACVCVCVFFLLRYMGAGGAATSLTVLQFFEDIGIPILEGYGLTETSPVISIGT